MKHIIKKRIKSGFITFSIVVGLTGRYRFVVLIYRRWYRHIFMGFGTVTAIQKRGMIN